jgi:hypothetical protein
LAVLAGRQANEPPTVEAHLGGQSRCLYRDVGRERATAIVFRWRLQLFVPFAPKDARLERVRRSKRDRPDPEFEEMKA